MIVRLGSTDITDAFAAAEDDRTLVGLVEGLDDGRQHADGQCRRRDGRRRPARPAHPGQPSRSAGPIFSGPQQQPFVCTTARGRFDGRPILGQPLVDNQDQIGIPVAAEDARRQLPAGRPRLPHRRGPDRRLEQGLRRRRPATATCTGRPPADSFHWLDDPPDRRPPTSPPTTTLGRRRRCRSSSAGSGARSTASSTASPCWRPSGEADPAAPDDSLWNRRLVFSFQGGVGIGHLQGTTSDGAMLPADLLGQGYGVMWSSGTRTSTHYNLQVGGETALMLKEHTVEAPRRARLHRGRRRVGRRHPAVRLRPEPPGADRRRHPPVLVPRHGHPDDPRRRLRAAGALLRRHRPRQPPAGRTRRCARRSSGSTPPTSPRTCPRARSTSGTGSTGSTASLGYQVMDRDPASPAPALTECQAGWFGLTPLALNPTFTNVDDIDKLAQGTDGRRVDPLGRHREHLRPGRRRVRPGAVGQRGRAVRPAGAGRWGDHARRVPRPQRPGRRAGRTPPRWCPRASRSQGALQPRELRPVELAEHEPQPRRRRHAGGPRARATPTRCAPPTHRAWSSRATSTSRSSTGGTTSRTSWTCTTATSPSPPASACSTPTAMRRTR